MGVAVTTRVTLLGTQARSAWKLDLLVLWRRFYRAELGKLTVSVHVNRGFAQLRF